MLLDLVERRFHRAVGDAGHRGHPLAVLLVGHGHHQGVGDRRMCVQGGLDLLGVHLLATGVDALRTAAQEDDAAVGLDGSHVTEDGDPTTVGQCREGLGGLLLVLVVAERDVADAGDVTDVARAWLDLVQPIIDHHHPVGRRHLQIAVLVHHDLAVVTRLRRSEVVPQHQIGFHRQHPVTHVLRPDRATGGDGEHRRQIHVALALLELLHERHPHGVADDQHDVDLLALHLGDDGRRVEVALDHQTPAEGEEGEQRVRRRAVHERSGQQERDGTEILDRRAQFIEVLARLAVRVAAGEWLAEEVVVLPHDTLGVAGGAARVEQVELLTGPRLEVAFGGLGLIIAEGHDLDCASAGQIGCRSGQFLDDVTDHEHRPNGRDLDEQFGDAALMFGQLDDDRTGIGVVEDVLQLGSGVAVVDVDRNRTHLEQTEQARDVLDAVLQEQRHIVEGTDSVAGEQVRDLVGEAVEFGVADLPTLVAQCDPLGHRVGDRLENVGEVELHSAHSLLPAVWVVGTDAWVLIG